MIKKAFKNKVLVILLAVLFLFGIWNLAWYVITTHRYSSFMENIPKNEWGLYFIEKDGVMYSVKKPDYLSWTGNLGVVDRAKNEALIIWPSISGRYKYGIRILKDGVGHQFYVNENMEPASEKDAVAFQAVAKYRDELGILMSKAQEMWHLSSP